MHLSIIIPFCDDVEEVAAMIASVQQTIPATLQIEFVLVAVCCSPSKALAYQFPVPVRILSASSIPAAKNRAVKEAAGEFLLFLLPGIFPTAGAIQRLVDVVEPREGPAAATGRWCNAAGKLEIGYNVRRFPTIRALLLDILLLNKVFPRNRSTRQYKMHDFDHQQFVDINILRGSIHQDHLHGDVLLHCRCRARLSCSSGSDQRFNRI